AGARQPSQNGGAPPEKGGGVPAPGQYLKDGLGTRALAGAGGGRRGAPCGDANAGVTSGANLPLDLQVLAPFDHALLPRRRAPAGAGGRPPLAAAPVEHYLHGVVAPEGAPQGFVEFQPPAPHDEQEPADRRSHGAWPRGPYRRLERTDGNQRISGESSHRIVSSRWAPVEMRQNGVPINSSSRSR